MTSEDEAGDMESIGATGGKLEEAVDGIVQATIEDHPFPEPTYARLL